MPKNFWSCNAGLFDTAHLRYATLSLSPLQGKRSSYTTAHCRALSSYLGPVLARPPLCGLSASSSLSLSLLRLRGAPLPISAAPLPWLPLPEPRRAAALPAVGCRPAARPSAWPALCPPVAIHALPLTSSKAQLETVLFAQLPMCCIPAPTRYISESYGIFSFEHVTCTPSAPASCLPMSRRSGSAVGPAQIFKAPVAQNAARHLGIIPERQGRTPEPAAK